jgi:hypothetical protein
MTLVKKIPYVFFSIVYIIWAILSVVFFVQMLMSFPENGSGEFKGGLLLWFFSLGILGCIILLILFIIKGLTLNRIFLKVFYLILFSLTLLLIKG